jgi:hypothetical protein
MAQDLPETADPKMIALHRHWLNADSIRVRIGADILSKEEKETLHGLTGEALWLMVFGVQHSMFLALSVWYALLYVVVEGYKELGHSDKEIENLLAQEEYVDVLRRFRNATFHYQTDPLSEKLLGFLTKEDSEVWIKKLNAAFDAFFSAYPPINQFMATLK